VSGGLHVAVVGGGITGLAAAHALGRAGPDRVHVTVLEASPRLGGKVRSAQLAGISVDVGPEALLTRLPSAIELCRELGLAHELVAPLASKTFVWTRGRLCELPPGILGGLPDGVGPVLRSGLLSPAGAARAGVDLVLPRRGDSADESVGALVRRRLGREALERMIDPLLGGIYAGDCDHLSVRATAPQLEALAREHRSLIRGMRAAGRSAVPSTGPMFVTLPGGLERIVGRLRDLLRDVDVRCGTPVRGLLRTADGRYRLELANGPPLHADGVIIAVPAFEAGLLLEQASPAAAAQLREIEYASVAVAWLAYPASALPTPLEGTGFLVPRVEGRLLGACTWASAKWPHLAETGHLLLRCSVGRSGQSQARMLDDATLLERVAGELQEAIGVRGRPLAAHVTRWERALPQYAVGHLERVERIEEAIARFPRLALAGAAYRGMGVPQCIAQGRAAAGQILADLSPTAGSVAA
jgi:protoporphyrinogen/coproporphyrinogen III oxidase